jgi:uncharacterized protein
MSQGAQAADCRRRLQPRSDPTCHPFKDDRRYRSWQHDAEPEANAAIIYMMDVSGSMTDEQKEIVRTESFWIDTWLKSQYEAWSGGTSSTTRSAKEVDEHTFYHTRESGGTRISSAYKVCRRSSHRDFPGRLEHLLLPVLRRRQLGRRQASRPRNARENCCPVCNLFCYGQVESPYGSGE